MPTYTLDVNTKQLSSDSYVRATREYDCSCGTRSTIAVDWPEGLTVEGPVDINSNCIHCGQRITFPPAHYYVENYRLLTK
jgi:hypothetical protein